MEARSWLPVDDYQLIMLSYAGEFSRTKLASRCADWRRAGKCLRHVIILVPHHELFTTWATPLWDHDPWDRTALGLEVFTSVWIDEIHLFRKRRVDDLFFDALSPVKVGMTSTPVVTDYQVTVLPDASRTPSNFALDRTS
jgi:hypothetical protein